MAACCANCKCSKCFGCCCAEATTEHPKKKRAKDILAHVHTKYTPLELFLQSVSEYFVSKKNIPNPPVADPN